MKSKDGQFSILIPDGESRMLIYIVNCLSLKKDVKIYVMSNQKYIASRYSRHVHNFSFYPKVDKKILWIKNINEELKKHNIDIIMPIYTDGIKTIIEYKKKIDSSCKLCFLPSFENFKIANNKGLFAKHLFNSYLPSPKSLLFEASKLSNLNSLNFPILIKPLESIGGGSGFYLFNSKTHIIKYLKTNKLKTKYLAQEYIKGYDIGCSVLCKSGNILTFTIQKATLNNDNPFAPLLGVEFLYDEKVYQIVSRLIKSLNWSGVAHIDMRYDEESREVKIIEINPRFWGSVEASLIAGINFPYLYCLASLDKNLKNSKYKHLEFLHLRGIVKSLKKDINLILDISFLLNNTPLKFALNDPIPIIFKSIQMMWVKIFKIQI